METTLKPSKTFLIVEDDSVLLQLYQKFIEVLGGRSIVFEDASEALTFLRSSKILPDLVLTDLSMPGLSPEIMIQEIKADPALQSLRIIILSACDQVEEKSSALGAQGFIKKPINLEKLKHLF